MKSYSIGREAGCDIVIRDNTDVISRRHAVLTVSSFGKMTITDQSTNGTYVNGIRITSGEAVPVSKKDVISFAHVSQLNWSSVPSSGAGLRISTIVGGAVVIIGGAIWFLCADPTPQQVAPESKSDVVVIDSTKIKRAEKALQDSLMKVQQDSLSKVQSDSILKVQQDSIDRVKAKTPPAKKPAKPVEPKKEEKEPVKAKAIG